MEKDLLQYLPYKSPFLFVDEIVKVTEEDITGNYTFKKELNFYEGHFPEYPITPGVILTECAAQIGLVCLGIYLELNKSTDEDHPKAFVLTSSEVDFLKPVFPGDKVVVEAKKIYYRLGKLKSSFVMKNEAGDMICKGNLSGMKVKSWT